MNKKRYLMAVSLVMLAMTAWAGDVANGEWAWMPGNVPAKAGQTTSDHLFVRGSYQGETCDNIVAFDQGNTQQVWLWLDDDEFYMNAKVQALTPIAYNSAGDLYNEVAYNSFQCDIYLPENVRIISVENDEGDMIDYLQGDRLPSTSNLYIQLNNSKVIDGITYRVYRLLCTSNMEYGCHFSSKNPARYKANGALKKDDAPLVGLTLRIDDGEIIDGEMPNMIIANQEFGFREAFTNDPVWEPNDYRFIYGTGGDNKSQRFQYYQRVRMFGVDDRPMTEMPVISYNTASGSVTITATGQGDVVLRVDGQQVENPYTIERGAQEKILHVTATAQEEGKKMSETAMMTITIPARVVADGQNVLSMPSPLLVEAGHPFDLPVALLNSVDISALQCDVMLPAGFELAQDGVSLVEERVESSHSVSVRQLGDGVYRLLLASPKSEVIKGCEGDLFVLHLNVAQEVADDAYNVMLGNIVLSDASAVTYTAPDVDAAIIVKSYAKGDANGDGSVNVGDYVTAANYIMELNPDPFIFSAADVDDSQRIDVGDLVGIVNIVLGDVEMNAATCVGHDGDIEMHGMTYDKDGQRILMLEMENDMALTAWQMDMKLPVGLTLRQANLSKRAAGHNLTLTTLADGTTRLLVTSPVNDDISGHEGQLLTIVFDKVADSEGNVSFDNILLAERDMATHELSGFTALKSQFIGIEEVNSDVRIYARGEDIVVETPVETTVEFIMVNGMTRKVAARAGTNVYPAGKGLHIVRVDGHVAKLKI